MDARLLGAALFVAAHLFGRRRREAGLKALGERDAHDLRARILGVQTIGLVVVIALLIGAFALQLGDWLTIAALAIWVLGIHGWVVVQLVRRGAPDAVRRPYLQGAALEVAGLVAFAVAISVG